MIMELGTLVESALSRIGITPTRIEEWLGRPCLCVKRKERLNRLGRWAARILSGRTENAQEYLEEIVNDED